MKDNESIYVTRSSMPELEEYVDEIREIFETHKLTNMGPKHRELQRLLEEYLGVSNAELLVNGHMALEMTLQAFDMEGEVITTPFTFASTTHAIVRNGLTPVFCDIEPENYTIDVSKIESLITDRTCAILPVHVYGNVCDVEGIQSIAERHGLKVIYDAAHTFGETYKGKGTGTFGDASMFSFHATKVFNTIEGGCVTSDDSSLMKRLYELKNFGIKNAESVTAVGANAKMNEFAAAMGICNLRHVDREIEKRSKVYERYMDMLEGVKGLQLPVVQKDVKSNFSYFPVVVDPEVAGCTRDDIFDDLAEQDIHARKYFYPLTNAFDCFKGRFEPEDTPVAKVTADRVITLPIYPDLEFTVVDRICDVIRGMVTD
ncbi:MAG: DegT/DnrJ/EryC1/StrS family aminotransferase [Lachnospiraceae bacterium]|nr:DegT/DnrJ/EryC1/StrS family aminotransferase [Lachnospiraceae bacterium]